MTRVSDCHKEDHSLSGSRSCGTHSPIRRSGAPRSRFGTGSILARRLNPTGQPPGAPPGAFGFGNPWWMLMPWTGSCGGCL